MNPCPFCGRGAINVTTAQDLRGFDQRQRFMCAGGHRWREGDGPPPEPETKPSVVERIKQVFTR